MHVFDPAWHDHLILSREFRTPTARSRLYRDVEARRLVRVTSGVFLPTSVWASLDQDARYLALVAGARLRFPDEDVFSHLSAAALWRLPAVEPWPDLAESTAVDAAGGRSRSGLRRRRGLEAEVVEIEGVPVTTLARTLVDVARTVRPAASLAMLDFALRRSRDSGSATWMITRDDLLTEVHRAEGRRGGSVRPTWFASPIRIPPARVSRSAGWRSVLSAIRRRASSTSSAIAEV